MNMSWQNLMGGIMDGANIPIKAHTAIGNIQVVQAQQGNDPDLFMKAARIMNMS